jgi:hypothetical protein
LGDGRDYAASSRSLETIVEKVTSREFLDYIRGIREPQSRSILGRIDFARIVKSRDDMDDACYIHEGDLVVPGDWQPPESNVIVHGSLIAGRFVHVEPLSGIMDSWGSLLVLGDLRSRYFAGNYQTFVFVGGDMRVERLIVNSFEDSALTVAGNLETRFFFGLDIWAEVGKRAKIEYGCGYCLPIGFHNAAFQAVLPAHDNASSRRLLYLHDDDREETLIRRIKGDSLVFRDE